MRKALGMTPLSLDPHGSWCDEVHFCPLVRGACASQANFRCLRPEQETASIRDRVLS